MTKTKEIRSPKKGNNSDAINSWDDTQARIDATWAFCDYIEAHPEKAPEILESSDAARRVMAKVGHFCLEEDMPAGKKGVTPIPKDAEFRVFQFDPRGKRDKLVTIVLPPERLPRDEETEVWRCSWEPWMQ